METSFAVNLTGSTKDHKRKESDFYPTPPEVTLALIRFLNNQFLVWGYNTWEPACGDGTMSKVLEEYQNNVISTDIRHTGYGQGGIDFLETQKENIDAIITNPPFRVSEQFIRHALEEMNVEIVAMLLKSQYWHASKRGTLFKQYPPAWILPLSWRPDFLNGERGGAPTMECLWTVWIRGKTDTRYRILEKPKLEEGDK